MLFFVIYKKIIIKSFFYTIVMLLKLLKTEVIKHFVVES